MFGTWSLWEKESGGWGGLTGIWGGLILYSDNFKKKKFTCMNLLQIRLLEYTIRIESETLYMTKHIFNYFSPDGILRIEIVSDFYPV